MASINSDMVRPNHALMVHINCTPQTTV